MSQIFTAHEQKECEFCKNSMIELKAGIYKCLSCGAKEDMY